MERNERVEGTIGRDLPGRDASTLVADADCPVVQSGFSDQCPDDLVETDLLVEDVSIDGMCGVY